MSTKPDRKTVLLRAAYDLLTRCENAHYVVEAAGVCTRYDDCDCDGGCLREDIANELGIPPSTEPLPLADASSEV